MASTPTVSAGDLIETRRVEPCRKHDGSPDSNPSPKLFLMVWFKDDIAPAEVWLHRGKSTAYFQPQKRDPDETRIREIHAFLPDSGDRVELFSLHAAAPQWGDKNFENSWIRFEHKISEREPKWKTVRIHLLVPSLLHGPRNSADSRARSFVRIDLCFSFDNCHRVTVAVKPEHPNGVPIGNDGVPFQADWLSAFTHAIPDDAASAPLVDRFLRGGGVRDDLPIRTTAFDLRFQNVSGGAARVWTPVIARTIEATAPVERGYGGFGLGRGDTLSFVERLERPSDLFRRPSSLSISTSASAAWNATVADPHHEALRRVRGGHDVSWVPRILTPPGMTWVADGHIDDFTRPDESLQLEKIRIRPTPDAVREGVLVRLGAFNLPGTTSKPASSGEAPAIPTTLEFPAIRTHEGAPLRLEGEIRSSPGSTPLPMKSLSSGFEFTRRVSDRKDSGAAPQFIRWGALDLRIGGDGTDGETPSSLTFRADTCVGPDDSWSPPSVSVRGELAVLGIAPGQQDPVEDDALGNDTFEFPPPCPPQEDDATIQEPLVLDVGLPDPSIKGTRTPNDVSGLPSFAFRLHIDETLTPVRSHAMELGLFARPGASLALRPMIVFDPAPFALALVQPSLSRLDTAALEAGGNQIARWSMSGAGGGSWEIVGARDGNLLVLPPQALGETFVRDADQFVGGQPPSPLRARFSPPATLRIRDSALDKRFVEPPWNLRRILGYPGQRSPGAILLDAEFELLYGMPIRVASKRMMLAELGAQIGAVVRRLEASDARSPFENHFAGWMRAWNLLRAAYTQRLAVLRPWVEDPTGELHLEEGVSCRLRPQDPHRFPVAHPKAEQVTDFPIPHEIDKGLDGGATWGFEDLDLYRDLWSDPRSVAAEIKNPAFTALGGYGFVKASFRRGDTTIAASVALGRTHEYQVENYGRIGAFWHHAKHVIVYERTVVPTPQFELSQPPLLGVPAVRKVREYVEVLEPLRAFPDFGSPPATSGFLRSVEFKSTRILVDPTWKTALGGVGYAIPLWQRNADPKVYPRPQIVFHCSPSGGEAATAALTLAEPDKLRFFASTESGRPTNVLEWPAVSGIDFPLGAPNPQPPAGVPEFAPGNLDGRLPDAPPFEVGWEDFTFGLDPSERPVELAAHRVGGGPGATIQNLTFARHQTNPGTLDGKAAEALTGKNALRELESAVGSRLGRLPAEIGGLGAIADERLQQVRDAGKGILEAARNQVSGAVEDLRRKAKGGLTAAFGPQHRAGAKLLAEVDDELTTLEAELTKAVAAVRDTIEGLADGVSPAAAGAAIRAVWASAVDGLKTGSRRLEGVLAALARAKEATDAAFAATRADVRRAGAQLEEWALRAESLPDRGAVVLHAEVDRIRGLFRRTIRGVTARMESTRTRLVAEATAALLSSDKLLIPALRGALALLNDAERSLEELLERIEDPELARRRLRVWSRTIEILDSLPCLLHDELRTLRLQNRTTDAERVQIDAALDEITELAEDVGSLVIGQLERLRSGANPGTILAEAQQLAEDARAAVKSWFDSILGHTPAPHPAVGPCNAAFERISGALRAAVAYLKDTPPIVTPEWLRDALDRLGSSVGGDIRAVATGHHDEVRRALNGLASRLRVALDAGRDALVRTIDEGGASLKAALGKVWSEASEAVEAARRSLRDVAKWVGVEILDTATDLVEAVAPADPGAALDAVLTGFQSAIGRDFTTYEEVRAELWRLLAGETERVFAAAGTATRELERGIREVLRIPVVKGKSVEGALLRAFGAAPVAPFLEFNRKRLAYYFDPARTAVLATPAAALLNRAASELKGLGARIPTREITDRLVPDDLRNFDLATLFPDLAGFKLDGLFPGLKLPAISSRNVRITHGIDPQSQRAWVDAQCDLPLPERAGVFAFGPLSLVVERGHFDAQARMETTAGGVPTRILKGRLQGDWVLSVGGTAFVTFAGTVVDFDNHRGLGVRLDPRRIRMHGVLRVLSDILGKLRSEEGTGLSVGVLREGGLPVGVLAKLDLPLPDLAAGVFALSGVRLLAHLGLENRISGSGVDFAIRVGFGFGRKDSPFSVTILFLGGGGWLDFKASYAPLSRRTSTEVSIGILATAAIAISLGPLRGGVWIELGATVEYRNITGAPSRLAIGAMLQVRGELDVLGLVSVGISLLLEAQYVHEGRRAKLIASGRITIRIKICFFIKINISVAASWEFDVSNDAVEGGSAIRSMEADRGSLDPQVEHYVALVA